MSELVEPHGEEQDIHNIRKDEYKNLVEQLLAEQDPETATIKRLIIPIYEDHGSRADCKEEVLLPSISAEEAINNCRDLLGRVCTPEEEAHLMAPIDAIQLRRQELQDEAV